MVASVFPSSKTESLTEYCNISWGISSWANSHAGIQSTIRGHYFFNHKHTILNIDSTRSRALTETDTQRDQWHIRPNMSSEACEVAWSWIFSGNIVRMCVCVCVCSMRPCALTTVCPFCLLSQCSSGWGCPETLQDTDTRSPADTCSCSADITTSGASEMKHLHYHDSNHIINI